MADDNENSGQNGRDTQPCPYCGETILRIAKKCKHCRELLDETLRSQRVVQTQAPKAPDAPSSTAEKTEYECHPSMFRSDPVGFVLILVLCLFLIGLIVLLIWWLRTLGTTLTVTNKRSVFRKGLLSKRTTEVRHQDVRNIQITQSFFQRIFGVGTIGISSAGQAGIEIEAHGMPNPEKVKQIIDKYRN